LWGVQVSFEGKTGWGNNRDETFKESAGRDG